MVWKTLLCCGALPALLAFAVSLGGARFRGNRLAAAIGGLAFALAIAAGYFAGAWALNLGPARPVEGWHWWPWLALPGAVIGTARVWPRVSRLAAQACTLMTCLVSAWLLVPRWPSLATYRAGYVAAGGAAMIFGALTVQRALRRPAWFPAAVGLTAVALAGAVAQFQAGSLRFAQLGGLLTAAWLGGLLAARCMNRPALLWEMSGSFAVLQVGLVLSGYLNTFDNAPLASFLLLAAAPALVAACAPRPSWRGSAWWRRALWLAGLLLTAGLAVVLAI
jgi:hypothetical protein